MFFAGCRAGNIVRLRDDVDNYAATTILSLAKDEPPFCSPGTAPKHIDQYRELLRLDEPIPDRHFALIHCLANNLAYDHGATLVHQGTAKGDKLYATLARHGVPKSLKEMGFTDVSHFWEPWCVAMDGDEIASIAFAARTGETGTEIGVATMFAFRGRGFAAAVTAGWTSLPQLKDRTLFYSTTRPNLSSQRVIERLRLPLLGVSVRLQ